MNDSRFSFIDDIPVIPSSVSQRARCGGLLRWCVDLSLTFTLDGPIFKFNGVDNVLTTNTNSRVVRLYMRSELGSKRQVGALLHGLVEISSFLNLRLILVVHRSEAMTGHRLSFPVASYFYKYCAAVADIFCHVGPMSRQVTAIAATVMNRPSRDPSRIRYFYFADKRKLEIWLEAGGTNASILKSESFENPDQDCRKIAGLRKELKRLFDQSARTLPRMSSLGGLPYTLTSLDYISEASEGEMSSNPHTPRSHRFGGATDRLRRRISSSKASEVLSNSDASGARSNPHTPRSNRSPAAGDPFNSKASPTTLKLSKASPDLITGQASPPTPRNRRAHVASPTVRRRFSSASKLAPSLVNKITGTKYEPREDDIGSSPK